MDDFEPIDFALKLSNYVENIVYAWYSVRKPAVHWTILTIYVVDVYIMTFCIDTAFQLNT